MIFYEQSHLYRTILGRSPSPAEVTAWRTRPLEKVWPIVYFDGIVVHVRGESGQVSPHTLYVALGVNLQGRKELLGLWPPQLFGGPGPPLFSPPAWWSWPITG